MCMKRFMISQHMLLKSHFKWFIFEWHFMVRSQIIYGHRTAYISPNIVRFYGARTAPGRRQEESYDFWTSPLDIVRCPVKFRYYMHFKFRGARTAFGRVIEGQMTSAGHRTVPGRCPASVCTHRTGPGRFLFKNLSYDSNGADVWQAPRT